LYDPREILGISKYGGGNPDNVGVETELFGEVNRGQSKDGFVTRLQGDVDTIVGIVTGYESKILPNGSVECSLTITSKNTALLLFPKVPGENIQYTNSKFEFDLDSLIFYEQMYRFGNDGDRERLAAAANKVENSNKSDQADNEMAFENFMKYNRYNSFGSPSFVPTAFACRAGVFAGGLTSDAAETYIQWGFLEDRVFNKYFGHGDSAETLNDDADGKFTIRIDSSDGWTAFENGFLVKQAEIEEGPEILVPPSWDLTYNTGASINVEDGHYWDHQRRQKAGANFATRVEEFKKHKTPDTEDIVDMDTFVERYNQAKHEFAEHVKTATKGKLGGQRTDIYPGNFITKFDKSLKRVPIRDIFVRIDIVKDAFLNENNFTFRDVVEEILKAINEGSYDLWDWRLVGEENILKINDMNYSAAAQGTKDQRKREFDNIFTFNIMSKNSIVKDYNVALDMPDGDVGSMYAIQAMTGTPGRMYPVSKLIEQQSALQTMINKYRTDLSKIGFRYLPILGPYNIFNQASDHINSKTKHQYYNSVENVLEKRDKEIRVKYGTGIYMTNPNVASNWNTQVPPDVAEEDESSAADTGGENTFDVNKAIEYHQRKGEEEGKRYFEDIDDMYRFQVTSEFILEDHFKSMPLPMTLELTTYGISTLKPGDIFRVDYIPEVYMEFVYFQVMNIKHNIDSTGWSTTLETQFRVSPHRYEDSNLTTAPGDGDDETADNLNTLLSNETNLDENTIAAIQAKVALKEVKPPPPAKKENTFITLGKNLDGLKEYMPGKSLPQDGRAYMWDDAAHGFSTRFGDRKASYWQVVDKWPLRPWDGGDDDWDYKIGTGGPPKYIEDAHVYENCDAKYGEKKPASSTWKRDVEINRNFASLGRYLKDWKKIDSSKWTHLARVFKAEVATPSGKMVWIGNPCYYWSDENNRFNGYGYWGNTKKYNGGYPTYQGGVYWPGEKVYIILNKNSYSENGAHKNNHWAVIPIKESLTYYNVSTHSPLWDAGEWADEGWANNQTPDMYYDT
jgi:hypothetical protein